MPEIGFFIEGAEGAAGLAPELALRLRIVNGTPEAVHSMLVRCDVRIEPGRREYTPNEAAALEELFGPPERWGETLRPLAWTQQALAVGGFTGTTVAELPLACGFDFDLAATRYFAALEGGGAWLRVFFSGTVLYQAAEGVRAAPIGWDREAAWRLPVEAWRAERERHFPGSGWVRLERGSFERLRAYQRERGLGSCGQALERLLEERGAHGA